MNSNSEEDASLSFDQLCEKIAQGSATPQEIEAAVSMLDADVTDFSTDVNNQLNNLQP